IAEAGEGRRGIGERGGAERAGAAAHGAVGAAGGADRADGGGQHPRDHGPPVPDRADAAPPRHQGSQGPRRGRGATPRALDHPHRGWVSAVACRRREPLAMSRRLLALNVVLGVLCVALLAASVRAIVVRRPLPPAVTTRAMTAPAPSPATATPDPGPASYGAIASRNVFSPARSETAVAIAPTSRPILHGVVIDGRKSRAVLE